MYFTNSHIYIQYRSNTYYTSRHTQFLQLTSFIREGEKRQTKTSFVSSCMLRTARVWEMHVDLKQRLFPFKSQSPAYIYTRCSGPTAIVSLSMSCTVPWDEAIDEACERKTLWLWKSVGWARGEGLKVKIHLVEVGCMSFFTIFHNKAVEESRH